MLAGLLCDYPDLTVGRVLGHFQVPLPILKVSLLGVIPKKTLGEYCLIHHLSHPTESSVNNSILGHLCLVHCTSFDEAVRILRGCGCGAFMAKCDIESAFR